MQALRSNELSQLRSEIKTTLQETCSIYSRSYSDDGAGSKRATLSELPRSTVACKFVPLTDRESIAAGEVSNITQGKIIVPFDTIVNLSDQILMGSSKFEVLGVEMQHPYIIKIVIVTRLS